MGRRGCAHLEKQQVCFKTIIQPILKKRNHRAPFNKNINLTEYYVKIYFTSFQFTIEILGKHHQESRVCVRYS